MTIGRGVKLALYISLFFIGYNTHASEDGVSFSIHHQYVSPRALGMGDAYIAVANDYNAVMYNPAGLARLEEGEINMAIDAGFTSSFMSFAKDLENAQNTTGTDSQKQQAVLDVITKTFGKTFGIRGGLSGFVARPNWGLGVIPLDVTLEMTPHQQVGPAVNTTLYADTTVAYAYAKDVHWFQNARTSAGLTAKFVNRGYASKSVNFMEIAVDSNLVKQDDLMEGYTVDADFGMLMSPELPADGILSLFRLARPTFGLVVRNLAESGFGQSLKLINKNATAAPVKLYRVLDLGTRWEYPSFWIFRGRGVMDVRDIGHPAFSWKKGLHLGFEFDWRMASWWRGQYRVGMNQSYLTAGMSALFSYFNLDLVTYGEDVGTYNQSVENRIYMIKLNINI